MPVIILFIVGLVRTLLFVAIIFFAIRWLSRLFFQGYNQSKTSQQETPRKGETTIRFNEKGKKIVDKNHGEYVDFEEVE
jgi:hypothetical protein